MKKNTSFLFVFALFITLLGFNVKSTNASGPYNDYTPGCASTVGYSPLTGAKCVILVNTSLPQGCTSTVGYSPLTGVKCDSLVNTSLPAGCTSTLGYSPLTGVKCDSPTSNPALPAGCTSNQGFSVTTGQSCSGPTPVYPPGCSSYNGFSMTTGQACNGTVIIPTSPLSPVISGVSGPQTLNVNQQGTWTVTASDKNGGYLSYHVDWGEGNDNPYGLSTNSSTQQSATFIHAYSSVGIRTVTFEVKNNMGKSAQTSLSVNVGGTTPSLSCSLLEQTNQSYFSPCKNNGFENACFSKSGVFQGCTNSANNDCTANNVNANTNLLCSVGLITQPTIITSSTSGGTIYPSGNISVDRGSNKTFTFTPNTGYEVSAITLDNSFYVPVASSYTFYNVTGSHIIGVSFTPIHAQPELSITTTSLLPNAKVGVPYSATFNATGGNGTYTWHLFSSVLPGSVFTNTLWPSSGTCVTSSCGPFSGTPIVAGTYTFTLQVTSSSQSASKQFTLTVDPADVVPSSSITILYPIQEGTYGGMPVSVDWINSIPYSSSATYSIRLLAMNNVNGYAPGQEIFSITRISAQSGCSASDRCNYLLALSLPAWSLSGMFTLVVENLQNNAYGSSTFTVSGNVLGATAFHFTLLLQLGSSGNEVLELQKFLNNAGYYTDVIDGNFGLKTQTALVKFQVANGLVGDGIVGDLTRAMLNR